MRDAVTAFLDDRDGTLTWDYGLEISQLVQAAYLSAEEKKTIDLTNPDTVRRLDGFKSKISRGQGASVLF
jgi:hypothetical protein